jgi:hypothetical protein
MQLLVQQQDRTLTDISGTVDLLRQQAQIMGREVLEQNAFVLLPRAVSLLTALPEKSGEGGIYVIEQVIDEPLPLP